MRESQFELWHELNQFYIREAWLLDERRFSEWLALFTEDMFYFMPRRKNVLRRDRHRELTQPGDLAFFEENRSDMELRIARLETGHAWAEDPPSRTRHLVANLVIDARDHSETRTRTAFLVHRSHLETDEDRFSGYREDVLRKLGEDWKIARRTIVLDANVIMAKNVSVLF